MNRFNRWYASKMNAYLSVAENLRLNYKIFYWYMPGSFILSCIMTVGLAYFAKSLSPLQCLIPMGLTGACIVVVYAALFGYPYLFGIVSPDRIAGKSPWDP